jgi:predicted RNA-binding Zn ribbon-like protein
MDAPGEDRSVALALANSRRTLPRQIVEDLGTVGDLRGWLSHHSLYVGTSPLGDTQLGQLLTLREAVRELLVARVENRLPRTSAVESINAVSRSAPTIRELIWGEDGPPSVRSRHETRVPFAAALAAIASDAIDLIAGERHKQLRACHAPGCARLLLVDHPRRRWCSKRCGDRVRAASYYERSRTQRATN